MWLEFRRVLFRSPIGVFSILNVSRLADVAGLERFIEPVMRLLAIKLLDEFKQGNIYLFIKCNDQSGNENDKNFFIKFKLNTTAIDNTAPKIIQVFPVNNTLLATDTTDVNVKLYLNEPSECRASTNDIEYAVMEHKMSCATSQYDISAVAGGTYICQQRLPVANYYFKCRDNPVPTAHYYITLERGNELKIISGNINISGNKIIVPDSNILKTNPQVMINKEAALEFKINGKAECRYAEENINFEQMQNQISCIDNTCTTTLTTDNLTLFNIKCREPTINLTQNINEDSYYYSLNTSQPLQITATAPSGIISTLNPVLQVNLSTPTNTRCAYKQQGEYYSMQLKNSTFTKQIGRAHVWTPVTFLYLVCRLLLEKKKINKIKKV